ncbi:pyridoxine/pyridoxal/pyridoxamine kinase [Brevibacillus daliensis]|uniref:pyridoxine/pyridoxal/pyridoxamine kinase n=1 Tax=Brevibacillus daliensis TaxID=2892995 RepID=UPI001E3C8E81|nr:pyridoxine/pyridoxal/pyridoxamine kinase [Brevibacillus daliensis]
MNMHKALTIAGSDSSGGAGIQADLKTFQERNVYGMSSVTALVSMNENWAHLVHPIPLEVIEAQLETTLHYIGVDALKTGMLTSKDVIELAARKIKEYNVTKVVVDPVMICKGDDTVLLDEESIKAMREELIPTAMVVTPNLPEAAFLSGVKITTLEDMKEAAKKIHEMGAKYVLIKGGGRLEDAQAVDLLFDGESFEILGTEKIDTTYTHGAGCTYSAAITAELAKGTEVKEAVRTAKAFITAAIKDAFPLNAHVGPTCHAAYRLIGTK